jgi:transposase
MEATGLYHQSFTYFLHAKGYYVSIILPNKISNFKRTLDCKTITYKTIADAIAQFGLGRNLDDWEPSKGKIYTPLACVFTIAVGKINQFLTQ